MATQEITVSLPETVYTQLREAAAQRQRSVADLVVEAALAAVPTLNHPDDDLRSALAQLAYLNDAALWQVARSTMAPAQRERLAELHDLQQRTGLNAEEESEEAQLLRLYREMLLIRAQAAVLLQQRGYDVRDPAQFAPVV
ncbi:MAG: hypothetical protein MUD01_01020 [Chloroflexaceae bacterium]|jgi:hypothetical protein|nr:hypothetical protein [Chloroflexaceae bacterium]